MFADSRFGYLERVRFGLGYATTPIYWVADIPTRVSFWIDDVFVSRTDLLEENEELRGRLLVAQRELQLLESLTSENNRLLALDEATGNINGDVMPAEIINVSPDPCLLTTPDAADATYSVIHRARRRIRYNEH